MADGTWLRTVEAKLEELHDVVQTVVTELQQQSRSRDEFEAKIEARFEGIFKMLTDKLENRTNGGFTSTDTEDQVVLRPRMSSKSVKALLFKFVKKCYARLRALTRSTTKTTEPGFFVIERTDEGSTTKMPEPGLSIIERTDEGSTTKIPEPGRSVVLRTDEGPVDENDRFYIKHYARPGDKSPYVALTRFMATKPPCFFFQPEPTGDLPKGVRLA